MDTTKRDEILKAARALYRALGGERCGDTSSLATHIDHMLCEARDLGLLSDDEVQAFYDTL